MRGKTRLEHKLWRGMVYRLRRIRISADRISLQACNNGTGLEFGVEGSSACGPRYEIPRPKGGVAVGLAGAYGVGRVEVCWYATMLVFGW